MHSVKTSHFSLDFEVQKNQATHQPKVSQHSLSLFAKTNLLTIDQLSKEGSRQPCSQPTDQDKSISS